MFRVIGCLLGIHGSGVLCVRLRFIRRSIGTSLRIIEGSFRVGWFVLVFVLGVLRGSLKVG